MTDHEWHLFDESRGLEVKQVGDTFTVRRVVGDVVTVLSVMDRENWDRVRAHELELVIPNGE